MNEFEGGDMSPEQLQAQAENFMRSAEPRGEEAEMAEESPEHLQDDRTDSFAREALSASLGGPGDGAMIAFRVPEPAGYVTESKFDFPHVTLVYLGKASDIDEDRRNQILAVVKGAASAISPVKVSFPVAVKRFEPSESSDSKQPVYVTFGDDSPVTDVRDTVLAALSAAGLDDVDKSSFDEYNPHVTIRYDDPKNPGADPELGPPSDIELPALVVTFGPDLVEIPLSGDRPVGKPGAESTAAPPLTAAAYQRIHALSKANPRFGLALLTAVYKSYSAPVTASSGSGPRAAMRGQAKVDAALRKVEEHIKAHQNGAMVEPEPASITAARAELESFIVPGTLAYEARKASGIDQAVSSLLSSAAATPADSPERMSFLSRALVKAAGIRTRQGDALVASIREMLSLTADGNSRLARSLRARRQLRDRHGKWIEMGGGIRFKVTAAGVGARWFHGKAESIDIPNGRVNVRLEDGRLVAVKADKVEQPKAILGLRPRRNDPNDKNGPVISALEKIDAGIRKVAEGVRYSGGNLLQLFTDPALKDAENASPDSPSVRFTPSRNPFKDIEVDIPRDTIAAVRSRIEELVQENRPANFSELNDEQKLAVDRGSVGRAIATLSSRYNERGADPSLRAAPAVRERDLEEVDSDASDQVEDFDNQELFDALFEISTEFRRSHTPLGQRIDDPEVTSAVNTFNRLARDVRDNGEPPEDFVEKLTELRAWAANAALTRRPNDHWGYKREAIRAFSEDLRDLLTGLGEEAPDQPFEAARATLSGLLSSMEREHKRKFALFSDDMGAPLGGMALAVNSLDDKTKKPAMDRFDERIDQFVNSAESLLERSRESGDQERIDYHLDLLDDLEELRQASAAMREQLADNDENPAENAPEQPEAPSPASDPEPESVPAPEVAPEPSSEQAPGTPVLSDDEHDELLDGMSPYLDMFIDDPEIGPNQTDPVRALDQAHAGEITREELVEKLDEFADRVAPPDVDDNGPMGIDPGYADLAERMQEASDWFRAAARELGAESVAEDRAPESREDALPSSVDEALDEAYDLVLDASDVSPDEALELGEAVEKLDSGELSPEEFKDVAKSVSSKIDQSNPELAEKVSSLADKIGESDLAGSEEELTPLEDEGVEESLDDDGEVFYPSDELAGMHDLLWEAHDPMDMSDPLREPIAAWGNAAAALGAEYDRGGLEDSELAGMLRELARDVDMTLGGTDGLGVDADDDVLDAADEFTRALRGLADRLENGDGEAAGKDVDYDVEEPADVENVPTPTPADEEEVEYGTYTANNLQPGMRKRNGDVVVSNNAIGDPNAPARLQQVEVTFRKPDGEEYTKTWNRYSRVSGIAAAPDDVPETASSAEIAEKTGIPAEVLDQASPDELEVMADGVDSLEAADALHDIAASKTGDFDLGEIVDGISKAAPELGDVGDQVFEVADSAAAGEITPSEAADAISEAVSSLPDSPVKAEIELGADNLRELDEAALEQERKVADSSLSDEVSAESDRNDGRLLQTLFSDSSSEREYSPEELTALTDVLVRRYSMLADGYSVAVDQESINIVPPDDYTFPRGGVYFDLTVRDDDGNDIGNAIRTIKADETGALYMEHSELNIVPGYRGQGIGSTIVKNSIEQAERLNLEKITLYANITVGAYAWARAGFQWDPEELDENRYAALEALSRAKNAVTELSEASSDDDKSQFDDVLSLIQKYQDRITGYDDDVAAWPTPFELSEIGRELPNRENDEPWPGKEAMLSSPPWYGVLPINGRNAEKAKLHQKAHDEWSRELSDQVPGIDDPNAGIDVPAHHVDLGADDDQQSDLSRRVDDNLRMLADQIMGGEPPETARDALDRLGALLYVANDPLGNPKFSENQDDFHRVLVNIEEGIDNLGINDEDGPDNVQVLTATQLANRVEEWFDSLIERFDEASLSAFQYDEDNVLNQFDIGLSELVDRLRNGLVEEDDLDALDADDINDEPGHEWNLEDVYPEPLSKAAARSDAVGFVLQDMEESGSALEESVSEAVKAESAVTSDSVSSVSQFLRDMADKSDDPQSVAELNSTASKLDDVAELLQPDSPLSESVASPDPNLPLPGWAAREAIIGRRLPRRPNIEKGEIYESEEYPDIKVTILYFRNGEKEYTLSNLHDRFSSWAEVAENLDRAVEAGENIRNNRERLRQDQINARRAEEEARAERLRVDADRVARNVDDNDNPLPEGWRRGERQGPAVPYTNGTGYTAFLDNQNDRQGTIMFGGQEVHRISLSQEDQDSGKHVLDAAGEWIKNDRHSRIAGQRYVLGDWLQEALGVPESDVTPLLTVKTANELSEMVRALPQVRRLFSQENEANMADFMNNRERAIVGQARWLRGQLASQNDLPDGPDSGEGEEGQRSPEPSASPDAPPSAADAPEQAAPAAPESSESPVQPSPAPAQPQRGRGMGRGPFTRDPNAKVQDKNGNDLSPGSRAKDRTGRAGTIRSVRDDNGIQYVSIRWDDNGRAQLRAASRLELITVGDQAGPGAPAPVPAPADDAPRVPIDLQLGPNGMASVDEAKRLAEGVLSLFDYAARRADWVEPTLMRSRRTGAPGFLAKALEELRRPRPDKTTVLRNLDHASRTLGAGLANQNVVNNQALHENAKLRLQGINNLRKAINDDIVALDPNAPAARNARGEDDRANSAREMFGPSLAAPDAAPAPMASAPVQVSPPANVIDDRARDFPVADPDATPDRWKEWKERAGRIANAMRTRPSVDQIRNTEDFEEQLKYAFAAYGASVPSGNLDAVPDEASRVYFGKEKYWLRARPGASSVDTSRDGSTTMLVKMDIMSNDGRRLGRVERDLTIYPDGSISNYNNLMAITEGGDKGTGFASAYNEYMENWYIGNSVGTPEVKVSAALDNGGFVWALNGFDFSGPNRGITQARQIFGGMRRAYLQGDRNYSDLQKGIIEQQLRIIEDKLRKDEAVTPLELATVGWHRGLKDNETWLGKAYMNGKSWSGVKRLEPDNETYNQSREYSLARAENKRYIQPLINELPFNEAEFSSKFGASTREQIERFQAYVPHYGTLLERIKDVSEEVGLTDDDISIVGGLIREKRAFSKYPEDIKDKLVKFSEQFDDKEKPYDVGFTNKLNAILALSGNLEAAKEFVFDDKESILRGFDIDRNGRKATQAGLSVTDMEILRDNILNEKGVFGLSDTLQDRTRDFLSRLISDPSIDDDDQLALISMREKLLDRKRAKFGPNLEIGLATELGQYLTDDFDRNNVPGFDVHRLGLDEGKGVNITWRVTHNDTGQVFFVKFDQYGPGRVPGEAPDELSVGADSGARAEVNASELLRYAGFLGVGSAIQSTADRRISISQRAGDVVPLTSRPVNAVAADGFSASNPGDGYSAFADPTSVISMLVHDAITGNNDRHANNWQVAKDGNTSRWWVFPIDHGLAGRGSQFAARGAGPNVMRSLLGLRSARGYPSPPVWAQPIYRAGVMNVFNEYGAAGFRQEYLRTLQRYRDALTKNTFSDAEFQQFALDNLDLLTESVDEFLADFETRAARGRGF